MKNKNKSKQKLISELTKLRRRIAELERIGAKRKNTNGELQKEKNKLFKVLDSMEDGVYIVNQQHDIQYVNRSLEKEFGKPGGRKCYTYFHDRKSSCPWCKNEEVFKGKTVRWEWYSFKNEKTYDLIDTPLRNSDGSISKLEIFRDITERKKDEKRIQEQSLSLAQKNSALKELLEQISLEKKGITERIATNLKKLLIPKLRRLKNKLANSDKKQIKSIETAIKDIASGFGIKITDKRKSLSPREIEVCDLIREGLKNKAIARELTLSSATIATMRKRIRSKLRLSHKRINLSTYLQSL